MLNLTRQERLVIQFLALFFLIGSGIHIIRNLSRDRTTVKFSDDESNTREFRQRAEELDSVFFSQKQSGESDISTGDTHGSQTINLNTATKSELMSLPNVGEVTAQRIIDYRSEHHGFTIIDELMNVKGIGEKTFERIKNEVSVE